ncbi:outer membrane lipid asymmetry maintenance protein MlaD [Aestuariispira ectoiniformans]|uniref:outer membrane lipid asymmetry maintenance protein MlaD n=1 Tax=Aestuariispira ectoiniformans TaxID=2775080 RepID=UPI00223BA0C4|nr:outer membrane lipid asymmetry maintenance protein MlaD [Aestuariispira ectoiniformans]
MKRSIIETVLGAVVLMVAGVFLVFAYNLSDIKSVDGYSITARFNAIDGLSLGSDVRIGGVKVGSVTDQYVDNEQFRAVVKLSIEDRIRLPEDSVLSITSNGLLGGKYVKIEPGTSQTLVADGGELKNTRDVRSLEELIGRAIFLVTDNSK